MVRWKIDPSGLNLKQNEQRILTAGRYGMGRYAERIRDEMKEEYGRMTHRTVYGSSSPIGGIEDGRSLAQYIVKNEVKGEDQFRIGAKEGATVMQGNGTAKPIAEIFSIIEHGVAPRDYWTFKLPPSRESASPTGYWTVNKLEARPFVTTTFNRAKSGEVGLTELQADFHKMFVANIGGN